MTRGVWIIEGPLYVNHTTQNTSTQFNLLSLQILHGHHQESAYMVTNFIWYQCYKGNREWYKMFLVLHVQLDCQHKRLVHNNYRPFARGVAAYVTDILSAMLVHR